MPGVTIARNDANLHVRAMNKTAVVLGSIAIAHYVGTPYLHGEGPDAPPLASLVIGSTGPTGTVAAIDGIINTITDAQYDTVDTAGLNAAGIIIRRAST